MRLFLIFLLVILSAGLFAQETIETKTFKQNLEIFEKVLSEYHADEVLIAFDIDNALLAHDHALGSDQWFRWQMSLLGTKSPYKIADDFEGLIEWYHRSINVHTATTHLTDPYIPHVLQYIKTYGVPHIAVTARGHETRSGTKRELARNQVKYSYKSPKLELDSHVDGFKLPIYYQNGLAMLSGQDKGEFIKYLINETQSQYKVVIMLDDQLRNVQKVHNAFQGTGIKTIGLRFGAEDKNVRSFLRSAKKSVHKDFLDLKHFCSLSYL